MRTRWIWGLVLCVIWLIGDGIPSAKAGRKRNVSKVKVWTKTFYSKSRFGSRPSSKRRGKWVRIRSFPARSKNMREMLGKNIPVFCRLDADNKFECEARATSASMKGTAIVTESEAWPAGRMKLVVRVDTQSVNLSLSNKWKKYIPTGKKRRK